MRGDLHVVRLSHRGDLLRLEDTSHQPDVEIEDGGRPVSEQAGEVVLAGQPFPRRDRDARRAGYVGERRHVLWRHGFLEPERIVCLDPAGETDGAGRGHLPVGAHEDVRGRADLGPDGSDHGLGDVQRLGGELQRDDLPERLILADGKRERVELDGRKAKVDVVASTGRRVTGIEPQPAQALLQAAVFLVRVQVGVGADLLAQTAAEQAVQRLAEVFAHDVEARHVERAQHRQLGLLGGVAVAGAAIDAIEARLRVVGVVADERLLDQVLEHRHHDGPAEWVGEQHHLSIAGDSCIGVQPEDHPPAAAPGWRRHGDRKHFDAGHLHRQAALPSASGSQRRPDWPDRRRTPPPSVWIAGRTQCSLGYPLAAPSGSVSPRQSDRVHPHGLDRSALWWLRKRLTDVTA
jgi:hypothetical protein